MFLAFFCRTCMQDYAIGFVCLYVIDSLFKFHFSNLSPMETWLLKYKTRSPPSNRLVISVVSMEYENVLKITLSCEVARLKVILCVRYASLGDMVSSWPQIATWWHWVTPDLDRHNTNSQKSFISLCYLHMRPRNRSISTMWSGIGRNA